MTGLNNSFLANIILIRSLLMRLILFANIFYSMCFVSEEQTLRVTVLAAILTRRQSREKLQCLYENVMSNFRKTGVLKKIRMTAKTVTRSIHCLLGSRKHVKTNEIMSRRFGDVMTPLSRNGNKCDFKRS